jgi:hypothetical protein
VPVGYRVLYFTLFIVMSLTGIGYTAWYEIAQNTEDTFHETIRAIIQGSTEVLIGSAGISVITTELVMVIAQYLEDKIYRPRRERRRAEMRAEIEAEMQAEIEDRVEEARAEVVEDISARVREWNQRRLDAEAKGEAFDEPPPIGE